MAFLSLLNGFCAAAAVPVDLNDFDGTSWVLYGSLRVRASKVGTMSVKGFCRADFENGNVDFVDEDGYVMSGSYYLDSKQKLVIDVSSDDIEDFFEEYLDEALDDAGLSPYIDDWRVVVTQTKSKTKVTYTRDAISFSTSISAKAVFYIEVYGHTYHAKMSFSFKFTGDHPVQTGSQTWASRWTVDSQISIKAKKVKVKTPLTLDITISDYDASGLGLNDYKLDDMSGILSSDLDGSFCRIKNKLLLLGDVYSIESLIEDLILDNNDNVDSIYIYDSFTTATLKVNGKKKITLSAKTKFWADINYTDGRYADAKGTFTLKGKGVHVP